MSEYGYHYNIHMVEDEVGALRTMIDMNLVGWESFGVFYNKKGIMHVALRRPMTCEERADANMRRAIEEERREKKARYK